MPKYFIKVDGTKFYANTTGELELKDGTPQEVPETDTDAVEVEVEEDAVEAVKAIIAAAIKDGKDDVASVVKDANEAVSSLFQSIKDGAKSAGEGVADLVNSKNVTIDTEKVMSGIKGLYEGNAKAYSFELNTKADIVALTKATSEGDFTGDVVDPTRDGEMTRDPVRAPFIEDISSTTEVGVLGLVYTEITSETGNPAITAELAAIPEKDRTYSAFTAPLRKIAVMSKHSVELLLDAPQLANAIQGMITEDLNVEVDNQLLNGDGTGINLTGIMSRATLLDVGAIGTQILVGANHFDVLRIAMTKISVGGKGRFTATHILLNPVDVEVLDLTKDTTGNYIIPRFTAPDGTRIKNALVVENVGVPAGEFVVGDFRHLKVGRQGGLRVEMTNSDGTDFGKDIMAIKVVRRVCSYVKTNHSEAFYTGVFSTVKTALAT